MKHDIRRKTGVGLMVFLGLMATGCRRGGGEAKAPVQPEDETAERVEELPEMHVEEEVRVGGKVYTYEIVRRPSDSLPVVHDELGATKDNIMRITLSLGGRRYYMRTLTKALFRSSLDSSFYAVSILDGIRFVRAEAGRGLVFSLSVSEPNSDMVVPFSMTVSDDGTVSFAKADLMDAQEEGE